MIPEELVSFPQDCVVEEIRKRRERAIQTGFASGPPIRMLKNESDILRRVFADARIEQQDLVIENQSPVNEFE